MEKKKVSVVIPVYNVEKYLSQCLDSVLSQSLEEIEVIVVNDGSTDGSSNICRQYSKRDKRIRLIEKENGGLSSALNVGIDLASGKYIIFLDSDDFWLDSNILHKMYNLAESNDLDVVRGECIEVNVGGAVLKHYLPDNLVGKCPREVVNSSFFIDRIVDSHYFMVLLFIKRSTIGELRFNTNRIFLQDAEFNIRYCSKERQCMYLPEEFYAYRKHGEAITERPHPQKLHDAFNFSRFCYEQSSQGSDSYKKFCMRAGVKNFLFDLRALAEVKDSISDIEKAVDEYDLRGLASQSRKAVIKSRSIKYLPFVISAPLTISMLYIRLKMVKLFKTRLLKWKRKQ